MNPLTLFLPCAIGVEDFLADEVHRLTDKAGSNLVVVRTGVKVKGDWRDVMRLNLESRLAQRVLLCVAHQHYQSEQNLYHQALDVPWETWFTPNLTFKIEVTAQHSPLKSLNFAALKVKDAICDRFRESQYGARPTVDRNHPDARIFLHLTTDEATLYLDTSGESLFKRGWRQNTGDAPLKETLAAATLIACGWDARANIPLYDPCCGSGTIVIEAAQIAAQMAPGLLRHFAFEKYLTHQKTAWELLKKDAQEKILPPPQEAFIFGSDVSHRMVDFAMQNAKRAHVEDWLNLRGGDALQRMPPCSVPGVLLLNPPYGERIDIGGVAANQTNTAHQGREVAESESNENFFTQLARHWKGNYPNWQGWILSPNMKLPSKMHLKESRRTPLWNGPIECRLFRFDLLPPKTKTVPLQNISTD